MKKMDTRFLTAFQEWVRGGTFEQEDRVKSTACAAMGLAGEAGETCDDVKKLLFHKKPRKTPAELTDKIEEELGDTLWYAACLCNELGYSFEDVIINNVIKLEERYPDVYKGSNSWAEVVRRSEEAETL